MTVNSKYFLMIFLFVLKSYAGVMPSQSRIIFEESDKNVSLMLVNTNDYPVIVQTWIDKGEGSPDSSTIPFVSIPPVFRLEPKGVNGVRIMRNEIAMPMDQESIFWFNIFEIPPEKKGGTPENSVLVTMNTQIKLFYRPKSINISSQDAIRKLTCQKKDETTIACKNNSPIHLSVIDITTKKGSKLTQETRNKELMLYPYSQLLYHFDRAIFLSDGIIFHYIDDVGNHQRFIL
ncbi:TPA: molecular chaperone [Klebsiella quasipneumoniae subsp. quasipneumoniae]|nr:molecular chaperone [Klebsiella quasipneumoniae subsp. quasipneumoniae]